MIKVARLDSASNETGINEFGPPTHRSLSHEGRRAVDEFATCRHLLAVCWVLEGIVNFEGCETCSPRFAPRSQNKSTNRLRRNPSSTSSMTK